MTVRRRFFSWQTLPIRGLLLYPRHRLDASAGDLLFGLSACVLAFGRRRLEAEVGRAFPPRERGDRAEIEASTEEVRHKDDPGPGGESLLQALALRFES